MGALAVAASAGSGTALGTALHAATLPGSRRLAPKTYPIGLEMFSVRREQQRDQAATLAAVSKMGYQVVEFFAPYLGWTIPYAKQVRTQLDDLMDADTYEKSLGS